MRILIQEHLKLFFVVKVKSINLINVYFCFDWLCILLFFLLTNEIKEWLLFKWYIVCIFAYPSKRCAITYDKPFPSFFFEDRNKWERWSLKIIYEKSASCIFVYMKYSMPTLMHIIVDTKMWTECDDE